MQRGLCIHTCETPACVNPAHMAPLTKAEHVRRGGNTKLNAEAARQIRTLAAQDWQRVDIGAAFGVTPAHVTTIARGEAWA